MKKTGNHLSQQIIDRAHAAEKRLRSSPFWGRLYTGDVSEEEYIAWLVQMHKYARNIVRGEEVLAAVLASRNDATSRMLAAMSKQAAAEEMGHDDMLLADLGVLWGVSMEEAWGRVERTETAPSALLWPSIIDTLLARTPAGIVGVALALETLAGLQTDTIREALRANAPIEKIESALTFLAAHSAEVEDGHASAGITRADALTSPADRSAAFFCANAALALFEGMAHYLSEVFERAPVAAAV